MNGKIQAITGKKFLVHPMRSQIREFVDRKPQVKTEGNIIKASTDAEATPFLEVEFLQSGGSTLQLEPPLHIKIDPASICNFNLKSLQEIFQITQSTFRAEAEVGYLETCDDPELACEPGTLKFDLQILQNKIAEVFGQLTKRA